MEKKMDAKRMITIAIMTVGLIIVNAYLGGCDEGGLECQDGTCDGDTDADADIDADADGDGDTDSDTDADTDSDTEVDPHACDCLNGESDAEGCVNIEGEWYALYYCNEPEHLMTVTLTPREVNCRIEFSGEGAWLPLPFETTQLPTEFYYEEENVTFQLYMDEYNNLVQKKIFNLSGEYINAIYSRCD